MESDNESLIEEPSSEMDEVKRERRNLFQFVLNVLSFFDNNANLEDEKVKSAFQEINLQSMTIENANSIEELNAIRERITKLIPNEYLKKMDEISLRESNRSLKNSKNEDDNQSLRSSTISMESDIQSIPEGQELTESALIEYKSEMTNKLLKTNEQSKRRVNHRLAMRIVDINTILLEKLKSVTQEIDEFNEIIQTPNLNKIKEGRENLIDMYTLTRDNILDQLTETKNYKEEYYQILEKLNLEEEGNLEQKSTTVKKRATIGSKIPETIQKILEISSNFLNDSQQSPILQEILPESIDTEVDEETQSMIKSIAEKKTPVTKKKPPAPQTVTIPHQVLLAQKNLEFLRDIRSTLTRNESTIKGYADLVDDIPDPRKMIPLIIAINSELTEVYSFYEEIMSSLQESAISDMNLLEQQILTDSYKAPLAEIIKEMRAKILDDATQLMRKVTEKVKNLPRPQSPSSINDMQNLHSSMDNLNQSMLESAQQRINEAEEKASKVQKELINLRQELTKQQRIVEVMKHGTKEAQQQVEKLHKVVQEKEEALQERDVQQQKMEEKGLDLEMAALDLEKRILEKEEEIKNQQKLKEQAEKSKELIQDNVVQLQTSLKQKELEVTTLKKTSKETEQKALQLEEKLKTKKTKLEQQKKQTLAVEKQREELVQRTEKLQAALKEKTDPIQDALQEIAKHKQDKDFGLKFGFEYLKNHRSEIRNLNWEEACKKLALQFGNQNPTALKTGVIRSTLDSYKKLKL